MLQPGSNIEPKVNRRRRKIWRRKLFKGLYLVYIVVPIILLGVLLTVLVVDALSEVKEAQTDLNVAFAGIQGKTATDLSLQDYQRVDAALASLESSLERAQERTRPLTFIGRVDADIAARFHLLEAAIATTHGSRDFLAGLEPTLVLLERGGGDGNSSQDATGARSVELLTTGRSRFTRAASQFVVAHTALQAINLASITPQTLLDIQTLENYLADVESYNQLALDAPMLLEAILGLDTTQTYLVLAQNSDELRPSGGYISTWGWLKVRGGEITQSAYFPTTVDTPNPPPAALASTLALPEWWINFEQPIYAAWDASWYTDFDATAEMAVWYYTNGNNTPAPINGVIGIDLVAVEYLLEAIGSVDVPEYGITITPENFRAELYALRSVGEGSLEHKAFLGTLYQQVLASWNTLDVTSRGQLNRALLRALQEKHLLLYFTDKQAQAAAEYLNWGGTPPANTTQDYWLIAETAQGSKSSRAVQRQYTYDVQITADNTVHSRLSLFYNFSSTAAEADPAVRPAHYGTLRDYFSLVQVFLPPGTENLTSDEFEQQPADYSEYTLLTRSLHVPYDGSTRVQIEYTQPDILTEVGAYHSYRLFIQKQAGTINDHVTITLTLPPGGSLITSSLEPANQYQLDNLVLEYDFRLEQDTIIEVIFIG